MDKEPSFSWLVFCKAIVNTRDVFMSRILDAGYALLSVVIGGSLYWLIWGWPQAMSEVVPILMFSAAPLGIFVLSVFVWHLLITPAELAYEAARAARVPSVVDHGKDETPPVNWAIWKQRSKYKVDEFAALLAKNNPVSLRWTADQASFRKLILEEINDNELRYIPQFGVGYSGDKYELEIDGDTIVKKEDALQWAQSKGFDVSQLS